MLSPKIDATFRRLYRTTQARLFRRNVLVAAAVYMAFVSWDVIVAPETIGSTVQTRLLERLAWLENLARFLRHELKNQIVAVGTSIDLAQTGDSMEANAIYLSRAQKSLDRMRGLVSSATEATSVEAALVGDKVEQVDVSALVAERVLIFQQLHPSRQLVLRPKPGLFRRRPFDPSRSPFRGAAARDPRGGTSFHSR